MAKTDLTSLILLLPVSVLWFITLVGFFLFR